MNEPTQQRIVRTIALVVIAVGVLVSLRGLERLNTWYLASDQFAFLTLAEDLREGHLTRTDFLYDFMPAREQRSYDALAQTYRLRQGVLHSRYPPGFPALLAVAGAVFGELGEHFLNPFLYLVVLVVLSRLTFEVLRGYEPGVAFGASAAVVWLLLLLPTDVHLWGITVARDLPAHLLGLLALLAAVHGRFGLAGLSLGVACVVRPDAALYVTSLAAVALVGGGVVRAMGWGALGFVVGAAPLFAYNWATLGSPFSFTQGSEFQYFLSSLSPFVSVAHAADSVVPAGGGFRLVHLAGTLRGNLELIVGSFGWFLLPAVVSVVWGMVHARLLVAVFAPYALVATFFYGFWGHPDPRYLAGVSLCLMPLVAAGIAVACRRVSAPDASAFWRVGAVLIAGCAFARFSLGWSFWGAPLPGRPALATGVLLASLTVASVAPAARVRFLAPVAASVLLMVLALMEVFAGTGWRDPYQREQILRARAVVEEAVPPGSIVITSPALGRPGENITHYTGARAVYATELQMLGAAPGHPSTFHMLHGRRVFFLLPPGANGVLEALPPYLVPRVKRRIAAAESFDWFLNPRNARSGAVLYEVEFDESSADVRDALELLRSVGVGTAAPRPSETLENGGASD